jgi:hypothetical protein
VEAGYELVHVVVDIGLLTVVFSCLIGLQALLHVLSGAAEYDELPVRHNEVRLWLASLFGPQENPAL